MPSNIIDAILMKRPFDIIISNVNIANVFNGTISPGSIAIVDGIIALCGEIDSTYTAVKTIDGKGRYALPGFIDSHMHLESSMLTPANFAKLALSNGTTTIVPDPHEIGNVLGIEGVLALKHACRDIPLRVLMMAPSTVPSAPGFEGSGFSVGPHEVSSFLSNPDITGLGEVMDFNGIANGDENIVSVVQTAVSMGKIVDGHASVLTGKRLAAFKAVGIDSDHTTPTAEKLREELAMGFTVQIQDCMLSPEMADALNTVPVFDRICFVTDDVSLDRLTELGHLNHVYAHAVELGLDPMRAIRYSTINPAVRMRLYNVGAIAPGMVADIQLVDDIRVPKPTTVLFSGKEVLCDGNLADFPDSCSFPDSVHGSIKLARRPVREDFIVPVSSSGSDVLVNIIGQDGRSIRTKRLQSRLPVKTENGQRILDTSGYMMMAVFNRYGIDRHGFALIDGLQDFRGAISLTYGHDCHNLAVYGSDPDDMTIAANLAADSGGGICYVRDGKIVSLIELPIAGLISTLGPDILYKKLKDFIASIKENHFTHSNPMAFFTIMPLAVSPEIKCSDMGLINVIDKCFLPLIERD